MRFNYLILITLLVSISSCSVKKRTYRSGYYINWAFHKQKTKESVDPEKRIVKNKGIITSVDTSSNSTNTLKVEKLSEENYLAGGIEKQFLKSDKKAKASLINDDACGDLLVFKTDEIVKVKVLEIGDESIKYKRCDNLEGPTFIVSKAKIREITYVNGYTEYFNSAPSSVTPNSNSKGNNNHVRPRTHDLAIIALVFAILGLFTPIVFSVIGLILAHDAQKKILAAPNIFEGLDVVNAARIISIIGLVLWLLVILLFLFILAVVASFI